MASIEGTGGWDFPALAEMHAPSWESFHRAAVPRLLRWVAPFEKGVHLRADLVATVFLAVVRQFARRHGPAEPSSLFPWLRAIAHHIGNNVDPPGGTPPFPHSPATRRGPSPAQVPDRGGLRPLGRSQALLERLPRRWRIAVRLRIRRQPGTYARIASLFGVTESAARTWYHRAVKRMRRMVVEGEGE